MFDQGDIVLVHWPLPGGDKIETKMRPAIVISNKKLNSTQDIILAQITSNQRNDKFTFKIYSNDLSIALPKSSEVRCHKIFTTEKRAIIKTISQLESSKLAQLIVKICRFIEPA